MSIRNRELSQFGSFIYVENSNKEIGITTEALPYVGFGTTNPQYKVDVVGDANVSGSILAGIVSATGFYLNGNPLENAMLQVWQSAGSDIYYSVGNVGIGTSVLSEKLEVTGNVKASRFISTTSTGTAPFTVSSTTEVTNLNASLLRGGVPGANINSYDIVTLGGSQTLTNKTLTTPVVTGLGVTFNGSTSGTTIVKADATAPDNTLILPTTNGTLVSTGDTGVITGSMLSGLSITDADVAAGAAISYTKLDLSGSITDSDIFPSAGIDVTKLSVFSISGVSLGSSLADLTAGSFVSYSSGSTYNGSAAITVSVAATTANTGDSIVSRDASGDFSAGTVSVTNLTATQTVQATDITGTNANLSGIVTALNFSGTDGNFSGIVTALNFSGTDGNFSGIVTATDFNSTSDINLKENIQTVDNALNIINDLRGVRFEWKKDHKPSYGVIAQELQEILPELVTDTNPKTVNYNGIIGVLIEAVKELSAEVEYLKSKLN
jgi:hypothetical protein